MEVPQSDQDLLRPRFCKGTGRLRLVIGLANNLTGPEWDRDYHLTTKFV
jgi:hypothetical protein